MNTGYRIQMQDARLKSQLSNISADFADYTE